MNADWVRQVCLSFPHVTESVQWGNHLVFKIAGKIFVIAALEPGGNFLSLKSSPEEFVELIERPGIIPAPYMARAHWVALETSRSLEAAELRQRLRRAYDLVFEKLPKKTRAQLS